MANEKRRYLPSSERKREILDAAFLEFSSSGFLATSLERIANRAGISKSGIYSHYKSKNEIFEDMLMMTLLPEDARIPDLEIELAESLPKLIDRYLDRRYLSLSTPKATAAFRLLITESGRVPELVKKCVQRLIARSSSSDQDFIMACLRKKFIPKNISTDEYLLTNSPAILWLTLMTFFPGSESPVPIAQAKELHKRLLLERLQGESRNR